MKARAEGKHMFSRAQTCAEAHNIMTKDPSKTERKISPWKAEKS